MTREEAIKIISQMIKDEEGFLSDNTVEAHKMAIKALEQEPILDKIRAEIDSHCSDNRDRNDGLYIAMKIIDKYKSKGEKKMSEISETEIEAMTKEQNYMRAYKDGKSDVLEELRAEIQDIAFDSQEIDGEHESFIIVDFNDVLNIIDKYKKEVEE